MEIGISVKLLQIGDLDLWQWCNTQKLSQSTKYQFLHDVALKLKLPDYFHHYQNCKMVKCNIQISKLHFFDKGKIWDKTTLESRTVVCLVWTNKCHTIVIVIFSFLLRRNIVMQQ